MPSKDGDWTRQLLQVMFMRAMEGESRIEEKWPDVVASRHTVRVKQWLGSMAGLLVCVVGLAAVGAPVAWAGGLTSFLDIALVGTFVALITMLIIGLSGWALANKPPQLRILLSGLVGSLVLMAIILIALRIAEPEPWHAPLAMIGVVVLVPSLAFTYNQVRELIDPMGWLSALERQLTPYLHQMLDLPGEQQEYTRLVPAHANGQTHATSYQPNRTPPLHPDDLDLVAFIEEAQRRGLARSAWLEGKQIKLRPTGTHVSRNKYDELMNAAAKWGFVEPGGGGVAASWLIEPDQALEILKREIREVGLPA